MWRYVWKPPKGRARGKWDKPPFRPDGKAASSTDPSTWSSFDAALAAYRRAGSFDGVGIVLACGEEADPDTLHAGDLDHCRDPSTGAVESWAEEVLRRFDVYAEASPSGEGVRFFFAGWHDFGGGRQGRRRGALETYRGGRYVTLTGHHLEGTPRTIERRTEALAWLMAEHIDPPAREPERVSPCSPPRRKDRQERPNPMKGKAPGSAADLADDDLLRRGYEMANGQKLRDLMAGDWSGYPSQSEGDQALACKLFWLTNRDRARTDRLFRLSPLGGEGTKWAERDDYREQTLDGAEKTTQGGYDPTHYKAEGGTGHALGSLTLRANGQRRTDSGRITVSLTVLEYGAKVDSFSISNVASNRDKVADKLAKRAGVDKDEADEALGRILAQAEASLEEKDRNATTGGRRIRDVVAARVPPALGLAFRTNRGLWSETLRGEVTPHEFSRHTPRWLIDECASADDRPPGDENQLVYAVRPQLEVLWATLRCDLPGEEGAATLGPDSAAAVRFREAVVSAWTRTALTERRKTNNGPDVVLQTSLAATVRPAARAFLAGEATPEGPEAWHPIHGGYPAWSRFVPPSERGPRQVMLAMLWRLLPQMREPVECPHHAAFLSIGQRYGCFQTDQALADLPFPDTLDDGVPLAVLTPELTNHLIAEPTPEEAQVEVGPDEIPQ